MNVWVVCHFRQPKQVKVHHKGLFPSQGVCIGSCRVTCVDPTLLGKGQGGAGRATWHTALLLRSLVLSWHDLVSSLQCSALRSILSPSSFSIFRGSQAAAHGLASFGWAAPQLCSYGAPLLIFQNLQYTKRETFVQISRILIAQVNRQRLLIFPLQ